MPDGTSTSTSAFWKLALAAGNTPRQSDPEIASVKTIKSALLLRCPMEQALHDYLAMAAAKQTVLITGANTGLGLEVVKALSASEHAYTIILAGRSPQKVKDAIKQVQSEFPNTKSAFDEVQIDIEGDESIVKAFEKVSGSYDHLDCLINNAGK